MQKRNIISAILKTSIASVLLLLALLAVSSDANASMISRNLSQGSVGQDVLILQKFLNANGYTVADEGDGSMGYETTYFGNATKNAVMLFQDDYSDEVLSPAGLTSPSGVVGKFTADKINSLLSDNYSNSDQGAAIALAATGKTPISNAGPDITVAVNSSATLNGSSSYDPDGTITKYSWDFGDKTSKGTTAVVTHTYKKTGSYTAKLKVTDNNGNTKTDSAKVTVVSGGVVTPPVVQPPVVTPPVAGGIYVISFNKTGMGTVKSTNMSAINCGSLCSQNFDSKIFANVSMMMQAIPDAGYVFSGWTGINCGANAYCAVPLNSSKVITATFTQSNVVVTPPAVVNYWYWSLDKNGTGNGTVNSNNYIFYFPLAPANSISGASDRSRYTATSETMTATPAAGSVFGGWGGGAASCGMNPVCTISTANNIGMTVTFNSASVVQPPVVVIPPPAGGTYTISFNKVGMGTVKSTNMQAIDCGSLCSQNFDVAIFSNLSMMMQAIPDAGYVFSGWTGINCGTNAYCNIPLNASKTIAATFTQSNVVNPPAPVISYWYWGLTRDGTGQGTVTSNNGLFFFPLGPDSIGGASDRSRYTATSETLTARPALGSVFGGWGGDAASCGMNLVCTISTATNKSMTVRFNSATGPTTYSLSINPTGMGTQGQIVSSGNAGCGSRTVVSNCKSYVPVNSSITLIALPYTGYEFTGWSGDAGQCGAVSICTITMSSDKNVTANFR